MEWKSLCIFLLACCTCKRWAVQTVWRHQEVILRVNTGPLTLQFFFSLLHHLNLLINERYRTPGPQLKKWVVEEHLLLGFLRSSIQVELGCTSNDEVWCLQNDDIRGIFRSPVSRFGGHHLSMPWTWRERLWLEDDNTVGRQVLIVWAFGWWGGNDERRHLAAEWFGYTTVIILMFKHLPFLIDFLA